LAESLHVAGDEGVLEHATELLTERLHLGTHLSDHRFAFSGFGRVALTRRLLVALHADAVEQRQRQLRVGLPRLGADLPLVGPARAVLDGELVERVAERLAT